VSALSASFLLTSFTLQVLINGRKNESKSKVWIERIKIFIGVTVVLFIKKGRIGNL
jgi:hypothetical protein